uniref:Uncharacterized protein n=1 Tax=Romanomermis culicivorax TaxID=13658 RepID=A0A915JB47_ROMCU
ETATLIRKQKLRSSVLQNDIVDKTLDYRRGLLIRDQIESRYSHMSLEDRVKSIREVMGIIKSHINISFWETRFRIFRPQILQCAGAYIVQSDQ